MIEDAKSAVSHSEMGSPREFQSDISATPKGMGAFNLQTPKGNIGGPGMEAPITSTNASRTGAIDMSMGEGGGNAVPQTPATGSGKIPSLDLTKAIGQNLPGSTTNKSSGRLLLQSPTAQNARNTMAERIAGNLGKDKQERDGTNKRELPNSEFQDFLSVYDETMWQKVEEEKKAPEPKNTLDTTITDEIKEED